MSSNVVSLGLYREENVDTLQRLNEINQRLARIDALAKRAIQQFHVDDDSKRPSIIYNGPSR